MSNQSMMLYILQNPTLWTALANMSFTFRKSTPDMVFDLELVNM
jgi:hypothetical protein